MRCPSTLFVDEFGRPAVLRRGGRARHDEQGRKRRRGSAARAPEAQGMLCGSIVSGLRLQPGNWAGAYVCWGTENREAAVRFSSAAPATPTAATSRSRSSIRQPIRTSRRRRYLGWRWTASTRAWRCHRDKSGPRHADRRRTRAGRHHTAGLEPGRRASMHLTFALLRGILGDQPSTRWSRCDDTSRSTTVA